VNTPTIKLYTIKGYVIVDELNLNFKKLYMLVIKKLNNTKEFVKRKVIFSPPPPQ